MNQDQLLSVVRAVLQISGTFLITDGLFTTESWNSAAGAVLTLVGVGWGIYTHSKASTVAAAARLPEVSSVVVKPTPEGLAIRAATGSTPEAEVTIAK